MHKHTTLSKDPPSIPKAPVEIPIPHNAIVIFCGTRCTGKTTLCKRLLHSQGPNSVKGQLFDYNKKSEMLTKKAVFAELIQEIQANPSLIVVDCMLQDRSKAYEIVDLLKGLFVARPLVLVKMSPSTSVFSGLYAATAKQGLPSFDDLNEQREKAVSILSHQFTSAYSRSAEYLIDDPNLVTFAIA